MPASHQKKSVSLFGPVLVNVILKPMLFLKKATVLGLVFCAVGISAARAQSNWKVLPGHVPAPVSRLTPLGNLPATKRLQLAIGLPLRNLAELGELQHQLYDPASANYHKYLTPDEFTARFGPTAQEYQAVVAFARANGLNIAEMHGDRMLLDVTGTATDVERTFKINLHTYRHPNEARDFFSPDSEPSIPANLSVADIQGLSDFGRPHPLFQAQPVAAQARVARPNSGSAPGGGGQYFGSDFRAAYVPGTTLTGSNQTVALVQFDGYYASDITSYETQAGLPNVPLQTVLLDGFSGTPTTGSSSGNPEVSLDIEMVIAMAPGISKLMVYEGNPNNFIPNDVLSRIASDNLAKQVSSSWSWTGGPSTTTDSYLAKLITQGQSFFQASGDSDAYTGANPTDTTGSFTTPITSSNVTAVGGTTLSTTGPGGAWTGETVWNWNTSGRPNVGSSGGISTYYNIPYWQTSTTTVGNNRSTTKRNIPDVALTADNIYVLYGNGSAGTFGGTSCAAPLWAGFTALVNQQAVSASLAPVGFLNPALYALAASANYPSLFHDTTAGNNIGTNTPGLYNAVAGYDLCTGLGTPNGVNLINALAPLGQPFFISQPVSQNVTNGANVTFNPTAGGASPLNFQWQFNGANLTDGGNVTGSVSNVLSLAAVTSANAGNYFVIVTNNFGAVTSSLAVLTIGVAPFVTAQPANLTVLSGSTAVFGASAAGSASLIYQWSKNGTSLSNGAGISGASSNVLTLTAVTTNSAGNYNLSVSNIYGSAVSSPASLSVLLPASLTNAGWTLLAESATPTNGAIDPGETVTVGFTLQNQGMIATTNLVATLLSSANILAPGAPQTYGALAGFGAVMNKPFTFTAAGNCGSYITAALQLQDGTNNLGTVSFSLPLGKISGLSQNFDGVTAPALPAGWTSANLTGTASAWQTATSAYDTAPNSAFIPDVGSTGENALVSPVVAIVSASAQLSFRHNFSFEYRSGSQRPYRDGGVLEIQIGSGGFTDILSAGGSFAAGGYNGSISTTQNPLGTRSAWIGSSSGWQTVTVNLPASAAGQNIQLRWNSGTDSGNSGTGAVGWYVDSIAITDGVSGCLSVFTDLALGQSLATNSFQPGQNLAYTLAVTNLGPQAAANVMVTDTVPVNATFLSAPGGNYSGGKVVFTAGLLPVGLVTNFTLIFAPASGSVFTNVATAATLTPEATTANNSATLVVAQVAVYPPAITLPPAAQTIQCGSNVSFSVTVTGTPPLSLQWTLDGLAVPFGTNSTLALANLHLPSHTVALVVTNLYGSVTSSVPLTVQDTLAPVITLTGSNPLLVELGSAFVDPGATAYDACAGTVPVTAIGAVNPNAVGTNTMIYLASDGNGNVATNARTVIVRDTTPPTILGSFTNLVLAAGTNAAVPMPDVTGTNFILATDLSGTVIVTQNPTNNAALSLGTNAVLLTVADVSGNAAYSTNTIVVVVSTNSTPNIVSLAVSAGVLNLQLSGSYGATYVLESTTNIISGTWQPVATNTLGISGVWQFADFGVASNPSRFYRLRLAQ